MAQATMMGKGIPADEHTDGSQGCDVTTRLCYNGDFLAEGELIQARNSHPPAPGSLFAAI